MVYLITYDLKIEDENGNKITRNYDTLSSMLKGMSAARCCKSTYIVETGQTATELYEHLKACFKPYDDLTIIGIGIKDSIDYFCQIQNNTDEEQTKCLLGKPIEEMKILFGVY